MAGIGNGFTVDSFIRSANTREPPLTVYGRLCSQTLGIQGAVQAEVPASRS